MKRTKLLSAFLCGTMMVTMIPGVLSADEEDVSTEEEVNTEEGQDGPRYEITEATFPDDAFRAFILSHADTDGDSFLNGEELMSFTRLNIEDIASDIHDLTGIRYLIGLKGIDADGVQISSLDISGLDYLEYITLEESSLTSLTLDNESLMIIDLRDARLSSIDISSCPALQILDILDTDIMVLDMTGNQAFSDRMRASVVLSQGGHLTHYRGDTSFDSRNEYILYATNVVQVTPTSTRSDLVLTANNGIVLRYAPSPDDDTTPLPDYDPSLFTEPGVSGFVGRMYTVALNREADPVGKADWIAAVTERGGSGAEVARGFLMSPEFLNKGYSDIDFVTVLYRTFFNRNPDDAGLAAWVNALASGVSKEEIIEGFINSTEFANLCLSYGITCGGTGVPNIEVEPNSATIEFATRLYTTCLGRDADEPGMLAWARQLANQRDTGTGAARGFFFSEEFTRQNVSNEEYVNRLYRTFMGREADEAGFSAWVAQLNAGTSREEVFNGFAQSVEFTRICASYGIIKGS
ncbi:MAG: DUF4214 domain-containing protein [Clostridiales bacterium]|nr:DUF4214 domain-containing protein [Clostridiales bacterium]